MATQENQRSRWQQPIFRIAEQIRCGELTIELADGSQHRFQGSEGGPSGHIRLKRARTIWRFLMGGGLGFAEAYLDGDWDSPDLPRLLELLALNEQAYADGYYGSIWYRWLARLQHLGRPNSRRGSRRNILAHYDLGNAFYERWLDRTMTYSAARYDAPDHSLEEAQRSKYASLAKRLEIAPDHHVLEIGCGWGGFAEFVAREIGAHVTAITISEEQYAYASGRIQNGGLGDRVELRLQDYRDVDTPYDRIASIEMIEAVGERYWPVFFAKLRDLMVPGGRAGLQLITIADRYFDAYRTGADFIQRYVFPGGMLPSPRVLEEQIRRAGLRQIAEFRFSQDYARTLGAWNRRFQAAWPEIRKLGFDWRFKRIWEYYLAYCEAGFRVGFTDVHQVILHRT